MHPHNTLLLPAAASTAAAALLLLAHGSALAQAVNPPKDPHVVKAGLSRYETNTVTSGISGIGIPPGADATTGNATTALFTYEYHFQPNWGLEIALGVPPKIEARAAGSVAFLGKVLEARNYSPTVLLTYHFFDPQQAVRPYVGIGLNYTRFGNIKTPYPWQVGLTDSIGWAAHAGVDWKIGARWGIYASFAASEVKTELTAVGATVLKSTIDFRPRVYSVGVLFRF
jgi:outer membrane protein